MKIKKDTELIIYHIRKGVFFARAKEDFDTETADFYPVILTEKGISGISEDWKVGEEIPCRKDLVRKVEIKPASV